jgi:hypothetical protein
VLQSSIQLPRDAKVLGSKYLILDSRVTSRLLPGILMLSCCQLRVLLPAADAVIAGK